MAAPIPPRKFQANPPSQSHEVPLCFGISGPPGSGKTLSALRIAMGMARIRGGKPAVIDTEAGRARRYLIGPQNPRGFDFDYIPFSPPFIPEHFLDAVKHADSLNPSCIILDNASDEHEGPGGVLEWHDRDVPAFKGNEWAAWNKPKQSRRKLTSGVQQIKTPIIMTFRARPKTTVPKGQKNPVALGYVPIAGDELLGIMDLFCLLPPKSNGVAVWSSEMAGEDFAIKIPYFLSQYIQRGAPLNEDLGEVLALWQTGKVDDDGNVIRSESATKRQRTPEEKVDAYVAAVNLINDLDELRSYQLEDRVAAFIAWNKEKRADLYDRIVEANSRRARELMPPDEEEPEPAAEEEAAKPEARDENDDMFPAGPDDNRGGE